MCRALRVSPSGFYAWQQRAPSRRAQTDPVLLAEIRASHARSDATYGAPRILGDLQERDHWVGQ
jgi:putative transposase